MYTKEELELNAKLQAKKNAVRKELKERGILKREGTNAFDKYKYFTEAQYKQLFTELLSENNLELKFSEEAYDTFEGTEKQSNGRMVRVTFSLIDVETGYFEESTITGEGIDKGDKAGYKAYTGAIKYYLADTFLVATGDDPETDSPDAKMNNKRKTNLTKQELVDKVVALCESKGFATNTILSRQNVDSLDKLNASQLEKWIDYLVKQ